MYLLRKQILPIGLAALALSAGAFAFMLLSTWDSGTRLLDLAVYHAGGSAVLHGAPLYDEPVVPDKQLMFTYAPIAALLFSALALLPLKVAEAIWSVGELASLFGVVWLALGAIVRLPHRARIGTAALISAGALWLEPVLWHLLVGQIDLLLMFIVLVDLLRPDARRTKGIGVGFAAGVKLVPAIFVLYLLGTGRHRAAGVAAGTFAATIGLGFALLPREASRYWLHGLMFDTDRVGPVDSPSNQSFNGIVHRFIASPTIAHWLWFNLAFLSVACGLWLAMRAHQAGQELLGIVVCALTGVVVTPIAWTHHWVWIVPALMLVVQRVWRRPLFLAAAGLVALFAAWPTNLWPTLPPYWRWEVITTGSWGINGATELLAITRQFDAPYTRILETAYPVAALVLFVFAAIALRVPRKSSPDVPEQTVPSEHAAAIHA